MFPLLGSLISGASSILGGLFGKSSADKANAANLQMAQQNLQFQRDAATKGLQWRAADATAASDASGINRLTLLGAPSFSPAPVSAGQVADTSMSSGIAGAGQDIGRALNAFASANSRRADLENKLMEAKIANVNSDTVRNQMAASKAVVQAPTSPTPLWQDFKDRDGTIYRLPSKDASQSMQNWASMPAQLGIAVSEAGHAVESEYHKLTDPVWKWFREKHGWPGARGDVWRSVPGGSP